MFNGSTARYEGTRTTQSLVRVVYTTTTLIGSVAQVRTREKLTGKGRRFASRSYRDTLTTAAGNSAPSLWLPTRGSNPPGGRGTAVGDLLLTEAARLTFYRNVILQRKGRRPQKDLR